MQKQCWQKLPYLVPYHEGGNHLIVFHYDSWALEKPTNTYNWHTVWPTHIAVQMLQKTNWQSQSKLENLHLKKLIDRLPICLTQLQEQMLPGTGVFKVSSPEPIIHNPS